MITATVDVQGQTQTAGKANTSQAAGIDEALRTSFGSSVAALTAFKPFYLTGDFNGDTIQDIVLVVLIKERRSALPKDVRILNPFESRRAARFPADPASEHKLALVIIHSWKTKSPAGKFLLLGDSPVLILDHERATSGQADDRKDLIGLISRRGKRRKGERLPPSAKGDVISLGTQVGDGVLYWNGRTYVFADSPDD